MSMESAVETEQDEAQREAFERAGKALSNATGLLITAGAGMSCDSGIPDYRGPGGTWRKHHQLGLPYMDLSTRGMFFTDPRLAWGFHGSCLGMFEEAEPHDGYRALRELWRTMPQGYRIFTSNVDGLFERSGCDAELVTECHGSVRRLQCLDSLCKRQYDLRGWGSQWSIDEDGRWVGNLPACECGSILRPNVLLFDDGPNWNGARYHESQKRLERWAAEVERLVVLEIGSGGGVPTVRLFGEGMAVARGCAFIRVNLRSHWVPRPEWIALRGAAVEVLRRLTIATLGEKD